MSWVWMGPGWRAPGGLGHPTGTVVFGSSTSLANWRWGPPFLYFPFLLIWVCQVPFGHRQVFVFGPAVSWFIVFFFSFRQEDHVGHLFALLYFSISYKSRVSPLFLYFLQQSLFLLVGERTFFFFCFVVGIALLFINRTWDLSIGDAQHSTVVKWILINKGKG